MPNNVAAYINYFRQLAVTHNLLQHDPLTETGKGDVKHKRFTTFGNNEVINGLRNKIGFPALVLELYDNSTSSETAYDIRQQPKGAFMVLDHAILNNFADEERAYTVTEAIMYDILKKIWQDVHAPAANEDECARPFKSFKWNLEITPTGKLFENEYGWYVQFSFDFKNTINISEPPTNGTFI